MASGMECALLDLRMAGVVFSPINILQIPELQYKTNAIYQTRKYYLDMCDLI